MKLLKKCRIKFSLTFLLSAFSVLFFLLILNGSFAQEPGLSSNIEGFEPYSVRIDIFNVVPKEHGKLDSEWQKIKRGLLETVAMLLEVYTDREVYFLARDSELLYDFIRLVTREDPKLQKRFHLLNVSRANMNDPNIKSYLAQEGITEKALSAGKKFLFVDTGYEGTIPKSLSEKFPSAFRNNFAIHLLVSKNSMHPSTRVFLNAINSATNSFRPSEMHDLVREYESLPHYTDRSDRFIKWNGRWDAFSIVGTASDGLVSKRNAHILREDVASYAIDPKNINLLKKRQNLWRNLNKLAKSWWYSKTRMVESIKKILKENTEDATFIEAAVRDYLEIQSKNLHGRLFSKIDLLDLELVEEGKWGASNKKLLIKKHPEWAKVLEYPESEILNFINRGEGSKLVAILGAIDDISFIEEVSKALGKFPATFALEKFVADLISSGNQTTLKYLVQYFFSQPNSYAMDRLIPLLLEKGSQETLAIFAWYCFERAPDNSRLKYLGLLLENGNQEVLSNLAIKVFSNSSTSEMGSLLRKLIEKANKRVLQELNQFSLTQPHWNTFEGSVFRQAVKIENTETRSLFLSAHLGKIKGQEKCLINEVQKLIE